MTIKFLCGSFIIEAKGSFLNGAGNIKIGRREISTPKTFELNGVSYPYISSQCWRSWLLENCKENLDSYLKSNILEKEYSKHPFINVFDDLFGYFEGIGETIDIEEVEMKNVSQIRSSPFQMSQLHPIEDFGGLYGKPISEDNAFIHLENGTPLPYSSRFYSANLECIYSLDIQKICKYKNFNDRQELAEKTINDYVSKELLSAQKEGEQLFHQIKSSEALRKKRILFLLKNMLTIYGGAKSTQYGTDISPKVFVLSPQNGCNPILSNMFEMGSTKVRLNCERFLTISKKYKHLFKSPIILGVRSGYLENIGELIELAENLENEINLKLIFTTPIKIIDHLEELL